MLETQKKKKEREREIVEVRKKRWKLINVLLD
jgi:hypothetical protein